MTGFPTSRKSGRDCETGRERESLFPPLHVSVSPSMSIAVGTTIDYKKHHDDSVVVSAHHGNV